MKPRRPTESRPSFTPRAFSHVVVLFCAVLAGLVAAFADPTPAPAPKAPATSTSPASGATTPFAESSAPADREAEASSAEDPTPSGEPTSAPLPAASPGGPTDFNLRVTAQTLRYDDQKHFLTLDGNVVFTHLDTQITAPHAEFYTDKQVGYFTKGVRITQPGTTITADKLSAFYADRKAVLTGHVHAVTEKVKPADEGKKPTPGNKNAKTAPSATVPTVMLCNELDYWWEKQEGDAIGDVKIRQGDKRAFSDRAHYTGGEVRLVHMYSNVRYERGPNDWMTCEDATIDMNTNVFTGNGNVEAYVKLQSTPSPEVAPTTPVGDRILKPVPPLAPAARGVPAAQPRSKPAAGFQTGAAPTPGAEDASPAPNKDDGPSPSPTDAP